MVPHEIIRLFVVIFIGALIGCRSQSQNYSVAPVIVVKPTSIPSKEARSIPNPTPPAAIPEKASETLPPEPTPRPNDDIDPDLVPCGVFLPLKSAAVPPQGIEIQIPADLNTLVPESTLPAVRRILTSPETVALVAFQLGREEDGIYLNADTPMPLASVVKIINLVAYAEAVADGRLDSSSWIPIAELDQTYLPGTDLGSHSRALRELEERLLIAHDPPSTPLEEVPWMMIRHSSNAAADYIQLSLGQEAIESTALHLGLNSQTAPCPWIGQFLVMSNHTANSSSHSEIKRFIEDRQAYGFAVSELADSFASDPLFRKRELARRGRLRPTSVQILFAENLNAQGSASDYAKLMVRILHNELSSPLVNILVRRALEWPMIFPDNQIEFSAVGMKNGSLPGVLTTTYYAQRLQDGAQIVVALFFRQLPQAVYRQWRRDLPHDELARWLLGDPEALPTLRLILVDKG